MKHLSLTFSLLICMLFTSSCGKENTTEKIIGKWAMIKVTELLQDVTQNHNPENDRWITFKENADIENGGNFESGSGDTKENTGKWFYDAKVNELFIDSDAGEDDDSYWSVSITDDSMHWKGKRFEFNKRFEISYERSE